MRDVFFLILKNLGSLYPLDFFLKNEDGHLIWTFFFFKPNMHTLQIQAKHFHLLICVYSALMDIGLSVCGSLLSCESVKIIQIKRKQQKKLIYVVVRVFASMDRCLTPHPDFSTESVLFMLVLSFSVSDSDIE